MNTWTVLVPADRFEEERLYRRDRVTLTDVPGPEPGEGPVPGDRAVLLADLAPPVVFGWGPVVGSPGGPLQVRYARRLFDAPLCGEDLRPGPLDPDRFAEIEKAAGAPRRRTTWLVSVDLPIEAETRGEAVRQFWSYLRELGPRELPAFVSPLHDEQAMQAYLLGEEANLDPEKDD